MLLGLDCGSTAVKAVLFSADGTTDRDGYAPHRARAARPRPRRARYGPALAARLRGDRRGPGGGAARGPGQGRCDRRHGPRRRALPLRPCGSAARPRHPVGGQPGARRHGRLDRRGRSRSCLVAITAQRPYPYAASTLLAWIARHQPERFAAIGHVMFCKDWIRYRLTGRAVTDPTDASTAFTAARSQLYSDELLALLGLRRRPGRRCRRILPSSG